MMAKYYLVYDTMTREQFIKKFRWNESMWVFGAINVVALIPQPLAIILTEEATGVSTLTYIIFAFLQAVFAVEFYLKKSYGGMVSMIASFVLSSITLGLIFLYR